MPQTVATVSSIEAVNHVNLDQSICNISLSDDVILLLVNYKTKFKKTPFLFVFWCLSDYEDIYSI